MRKVALIPARYQSSRFPGKPLALINAKPMIQWVYEGVQAVDGIDELYVATDDKRIYDGVIAFGGKALMTSPNHQCGSDRLAECVEILKLDDEDIVINIQGDEPLIRKEMVETLIGAFDDPEVYMATLKKKITTESEINNSNVVKVITDVNDYAITFSRYALPFNRDNYSDIIYYKHIGTYAYKKWFLKKYSEMEKSFLEKCESLEQLRAIENGYKIKVLETEFQSLGVDTQEQLAEVEERIKSQLM